MAVALEPVSEGADVFVVVLNGSGGEGLTGVAVGGLGNLDKPLPDNACGELLEQLDVGFLEQAERLLVVANRLLRKLPLDVLLCEVCQEFIKVLRHFSPPVVLSNPSDSELVRVP